jgi:hypothetical protein
MTETNKFTFSFDFDDTLGASEELQQFCRQFIEQGHNVKILTRRYEQGATKEDEHTWVYLLAKELGVKTENVHFTNRKWKYEFVDKLGINFHIDDDFNDYYYILNQTKCVPILFKDPAQFQVDWKNVLQNMLLGKLPVKKI